MKSVALVTVYLGPLPDYLPVFLETCKWNPTIDFLLFCEYPIDTDIPNVRFFKFTVDSFNQLASRNLQLSIGVQNAYKLCDFKPAYGLILQDYLQSYDFWGTVDVDVLWGDIRNFLNPQLADHDIITSKLEYLAGHFTVYRNIPKVNEAFRESRDYRFVFQSQSIFSFDECNFLWVPILKGYKLNELHSMVESMSHVARKLADTNRLNVSYNRWVEEQDQPEGDNGNFAPWKKKLLWLEGKLYNEMKQEFLYFHFHFLKKSPRFFIEQSTGFRSLSISESGITKSS